jgi:hypothetical protein
MAKTKTEETALAPVETRQTAMAVADAVRPGDTRGVENIDNDDVRLPFLAIAQKTSKAIDKTEGGYVPGLEFGNMYNSETREVYGDGPLTFIPLFMRKRAHLVDKDGRNAAQIAWDDPRTSWDDAQARGLEKPEARRIYDWVVLVGESLETVVLSFYGKSFGAGKSLNGFVKVRKPSFAGKYALSTDIGKNDSGSFGYFIVKPAGKPTADEFDYAEAAYDNYIGKAIAAEPTEPVVVETVATDEPF